MMILPFQNCGESNVTTTIVSICCHFNYELISSTEHIPTTSEAQDLLINQHNLNINNFNNLRWGGQWSLEPMDNNKWNALPGLCCTCCLFASVCASSFLFNNWMLPLSRSAGIQVEELLKTRKEKWEKLNKVKKRISHSGICQSLL